MFLIFAILKKRQKSHLERMEDTNDFDDTYEVNSKVFADKSFCIESQNRC